MDWATNNIEPNWGAEDVNGSTSLNYSNVNQEEGDLQRAIDESKKLSQQEEGVTSAGNEQKNQLQPATRASYDISQWSIVRADTFPSVSVTEVSVPIRTPDVPAFLRCVNVDEANHGLASLLTIFHEIPAARNCLLNLGRPEPNYGHHNEWWKGQPITLPQGGDNDTHSALSFIAEIHRLMAFLDSTSRRFGSIDSLANVDELVSGPDSVPDMSFLTLLSFEENPPRALFSRVIPYTREGVSGDPMSVSTFHLGEVGPATSEIVDMYTLLNMMLWNDYMTGTPEAGDCMGVLDPAGDVLVIRWAQKMVTEKRIEVPEVFYLDRYLSSRRDIALEIIDGIRAANERLEALEKLKDAVYNMDGPDKRRINRSEYCSGAISKIEAKLKAIDEEAAWRASDLKWEAARKIEKLGQEYAKTLNQSQFEPHLTKEEQRLKEHWSQELEQFKEALDISSKAIAKWESTKRLYESILTLVNGRMADMDPDELKSFESRMMKQYANVHGESAILKLQKTHPNILGVEPWKNDPERQCRSYLRGVYFSYNNTDTYVCKRTNPSGSSDPEDQWWRISNSKGLDSVNVEKVDVGIVMQAASQCKDGPVYIYASEDALSEEPVPLSEALKRFVKRDNRIFNAEDRNADTESYGQPITLENLSSATGKRKHRSDSVSSTATNRASCGDSDRGFELSPHGDSPGDFGAIGTIHTSGVGLVGETSKGNSSDSVAHLQARLNAVRSASTPDKDTEASSEHVEIAQPEMQEKDGKAPFLNLAGKQATLDVNMDVDDTDH